jgi:RNA polymerase sigma-70 factor (ECF subfamily)
VGAGQDNRQNEKVNRQDRNEDVIEWVALHVLPHEAAVRRWLRGALRNPDDMDDIIQEAYCRIAELDTLQHIRNGRAYFFTTARSVLLQRLRRERVVKIEAVAEIDLLGVMDDAPSPERIVGARGELKRVLDVIAALPQAYRRPVELRRIHGLSQKETASHLGVSEKVVENNSLRGLRLVLQALTQEDNEAARPETACQDKSTRHAHS